jgi:glycosyltransferase involved in cell wall biosynthesis
MKRILIDLTDLELWSGHHGGTQRVVYGLAKNFYLKQDSLSYEVQFMHFSAHEKIFRQSDFSLIYDRVESLNTPQIVDATEPGFSRKARLKSNLRPYVPELIRQSPAARKFAKASLSEALAAKQKVKNLSGRINISKPLSKTETIIFTSDDIVLISGKPWDDLNIQKVLSREKGKTNFEVLQVVYDLILPLQPHLHHPSLFKPYAQNMFEAVQVSDVMLPISKSSDKDLKVFCKQLNLNVPQTKVIRLGDQVADSEVAASKPDSRLKKKFIACVGTVEIRKNHILLYYAYKLAAEQNINLPQLAIVGSKGWLTDDFQYLVEHDPYVKDKILILDNINDPGLNWIYENCLFTIYPSMYEGWGLPVAESLAHGKLCIASKSSSIPEIAGELIDYFSPYDAQECLDAIVKYLDSSTLNKKENEIKAQYKPTSWDHAFKQVSDLIG